MKQLINKQTRTYFRKEIVLLFGFRNTDVVFNRCHCGGLEESDGYFVVPFKTLTGVFSA